MRGIAWVGISIGQMKVQRGSGNPTTNAFFILVASRYAYSTYVFFFFFRPFFFFFGVCWAFRLLFRPFKQGCFINLVGLQVSMARFLGWLRPHHRPSVKTKVSPGDDGSKILLQMHMLIHGLTSHANTTGIWPGMLPLYLHIGGFNVCYRRILLVLLTWAVHDILGNRNLSQNTDLSQNGYGDPPLTFQGRNIMC